MTLPSLPLLRRLVAALLLLGLLLPVGTALTPVPAKAQQALSEAQAGAVRDLVRETLFANPEIIAEALEIYQQRQEAEQAERAVAAILQHREALVSADDADVIGNPDGDVTVVEFSDYQCGYCKRVLPGLIEAVESDGDVRLVIHELPILGPASVMAARAAEAARRQDLFPAFHVALMAMKGDVTEQAIMQTAAGVGLDTEKMRADMADPDLDQAFQRNIELARALGVSGTPAFVIGDALLPGAVSRAELEARIKAVREEG